MKQLRNVLLMKMLINGLADPELVYNSVIGKKKAKKIKTRQHN